MYMHLTNVAIQKHGETYNDKHGNKWPLRSLELYIEGTQGTETCRRLFSDIDCVIINSLKACQSIMINDRHCFELYGEALVNPVAEGGGFALAAAASRGVFSNARTQASR